MTALTEAQQATLTSVVTRMEALAGEVRALLGPPTIRRNDVPPEYVLPDGTVSHVFELACVVEQGDWVQAIHGDTGWLMVQHPPIHTEDMVGIVTRDDTGDGVERIRWWGREDLIKVAEVPAPDPAAWRAERMGAQS